MISGSKALATTKLVRPVRVRLLSIIALLLSLLAGCGGGATIKTDERVRPLEESGDARALDAVSISPAAVLAVEDYTIGPGDVLDIVVFQVDDLSVEREVNARGEIGMPLIGSVPVAGKTPLEVSDQLKALYTVDYLHDPQISVEVSEYISRQVTLVGELRRPGNYPLRGHTTLLEAMAMAGGVSRIADRESVIIFRTEDDQQVYGYLVNLDEVMGGAKSDPEIFGSDRIVVPESGSASFMRSIMIGVPGFGGYRQY